MIIDSAKYSCAAGHEINEDACLCLPEQGIFVVADGLGGHSEGERASTAAVDYFERSCHGGYTSEEITRLLEEANIEVLNKGDGGKTTVAAAFTEDAKFIYANVGDSRVYYFRGGKLIAMTKDHSVCQASVDMGMLRPEDIRGSEDRSRLLKVLGSEKVLNIKKRYQPIEIQSGDAFLVCSDGFWEYVYETEMEMDLLKSESAEKWLKYMLKRHLLRAENKGDNYTAICGIIYLEEQDKVKEPAVSERKRTKPQKLQKKSLLLPIVIAAVVIAAVAGVLFWLDNRKSHGGHDEPDAGSSHLEGTYSSPLPGSSDNSPTSEPSDENAADGPSDNSPTSEPSDENAAGGSSDNSPTSEPSDENAADGPSDNSPTSEPPNENAAGGPSETN